MPDTDNADMCDSLVKTEDHCACIREGEFIPHIHVSFHINLKGLA